MSVLESTASDADASAMARGQEGDWEAFGSLVDRHRDALVVYLARLVGDRERGEELAQEAFVRLWLASRRYREEGRFEAYLYSIGTRLARSSERRRRVRLHALFSGRLAFFGWAGRSPGAEPVEEAEAGERLLREEAGAQLARAVAELPLRFRAPLVLQAIEERSIDEIARLLDLPAATVKTRLFRARARLRERLAPYWKGADA
ncbi:MAG: RNA polymerase sigma factor [Thermoanaerobaculia bacterium]